MLIKIRKCLYSWRLIVIVSVEATILAVSSKKFEKFVVRKVAALKRERKRKRNDIDSIVNRSELLSLARFYYFAGHLL